MDLCKRTQQLWRAYLVADDLSAMLQVMDWIDPDCVVIGTGRHEFYVTIQKLMEALEKEAEERKSVHLEIVDEWYGQRELGPDACLVYGGLHVRDMGKKGESMVDMDTSTSPCPTRSRRRGSTTPRPSPGRSGRPRTWPST